MLLRISHILQIKCTRIPDATGWLTVGWLHFGLARSHYYTHEAWLQRKWPLDSIRLVSRGPIILDLVWFGITQNSHGSDAEKSWEIDSLSIIWMVGGSVIWTTDLSSSGHLTDLITSFTTPLFWKTLDRLSDTTEWNTVALCPKVFQCISVDAMINQKNSSWYPIIMDYSNSTCLFLHSTWRLLFAFSEIQTRIYLGPHRCFAYHTTTWDISYQKRTRIQWYPNHW